jgi:hypothetical protein
MKKHEYWTRRAHGKYPPGQKVLAWRDGQTIKFQYSDGNIIDVVGYYYLPGIDAPKTLHETEDENFFQHVQDAIDGFEK